MESTSGSEIDNDQISSPLAQHENFDDNESLHFTIPETPQDFDSWAPCKKQAWESLSRSPNQFFYRHVLPSQTKKIGPWSQDEKSAMIAVINEYIKKGTRIKQWGLFAYKHCPGRVGYQCNAELKKLISSGEIVVPPEWKIDEKEKDKDKNKEKEKDSGSGQESAGSEFSTPERKPKKLKFSGNQYAFNNVLIDESPSLGFIIPESNKNSGLKNLLSSPQVITNFENFTKSLYYSP